MTVHHIANREGVGVLRKESDGHDLIHILRNV